jgi:hypothetical protein
MSARPDAVALLFRLAMESGRRRDVHRHPLFSEYNGFELAVGPGTIFGEEIQNVRPVVETKSLLRARKVLGLTERPVALGYREFILSQFTC